MSEASATTSRAAMATITFTPSGETIEVPAGTSLLDAAILCDLDLKAPCAGQGRCGRCRVRVTSGEVERRSNAGLATAELLEGWAVACQTYVAGSAEVEVPERRKETVRPHGHAVSEPESLPFVCDWRQDPAVRTFILDIEPPSLADNTSDFDRLRRALAQQHGIEEVRAELPMLRRLGKDLRMANWKVSVTLEMRDWVYGAYLPPRLIRIYPAAFHHASMGLAIDLGTTSVVVYLLDFATGRVVDSASAYNKQIACGDDVISRIIYAKRKRGLERLQHLAVETINDLIVELKQRNNIEPYEIHEIAVAGNTTMTHLLLGLDPRFLREEPYIPTLSAPPKMVAGELGLRANVLARVHILPSVGSYVGGDITAGVISSGMFATDKLTLFIDIGTNGEMVLGSKDWLLACACSAGPAFEGGGVGDGMRASPGAIEDVYISDETWEPTFLTIDDAPAVGICGSGLIDLLGELFVTGLVDKSGHLDLEAPTPRVRVRDGVPEYVVCRAGEGGAEKDIALTESYITGLIRAKAAIYAGFEVLCHSVGVDLADVEQILIGGAFGQYINIEKAI
ncbi:MAG TPA: ASKHA domain-containing protein, partial [Thermoleophilia bacterium]